MTSNTRLRYDITFYGSFTIGSIYNFLGESTLDEVIAITCLLLAAITVLVKILSDE